MTRVCFDAELVRRYGGRGPRYTSYPTAPQFHEGFSEGDYRRHAAESRRRGTASPLSLYLHLPFCRSLCYYCGCTKVVTRSEDRAAGYLDALVQEARLHAALFGADRKVEQLHLGGGSPTFYSDDQLADLMEALRSLFAFADADQLQCGIEVDPRTAGPGRIARLAGIGFNRLSLGVQDFDSDVQQAVNRLQSRQDTLRLIEVAREEGFRSVSVDLIYGLPLQSADRFARTLDTVVEARPDRVSLYSYAHLPHLFRAQKLIDESRLPSDNEKLALLELSVSTLCEAGYDYIGMDHFALADDELARARSDGSLQRNFQGYSTHAHCDLVSLGASAIGNVGEAFYQNEKNTNSYCRKVATGRLPIVRGLVRDDDDVLRHAVIQDLMCRGRVEHRSFERRFGIDFRRYFDAELSALSALEEDGLVRVGEEAIVVTPTGQLLMRPIAMTFDRYLREARSAPVYSKVI